MIKLLFAGDFCCSNPQLLKVGNKLESLIRDSDICELNFEGVIPHGIQESPLKFYLNQSSESPQWCADNGFTVINLANNHTFDFGEEGIKNTLEKFSDTTSILGVGIWEDAYKVRVVEKGNKKIGFFALSSADLSSLKNRYDDNKILGCAWLGHPIVWSIL